MWRPLTLYTHRALDGRPVALTQKVFRLYCVAMGLGSKGSPAALRARLEARMKLANVSEYIVRAMRSGSASGSQKVQGFDVFFSK